MQMAPSPGMVALLKRNGGSQQLDRWLKMSRIFSDLLSDLMEFDSQNET